MATYTYMNGATAISSWLLAVASLVLAPTFSRYGSAWAVDVESGNEDVIGGENIGDNLVSIEAINDSGALWSFPEAIVKATGEEPIAEWAEYLLKDPFGEQESVSASIYPDNTLSRPQLNWGGIRGKWTYPMGTCPYGGSMDVEQYGKDMCLGVGEAICKNGWRFGIQYHVDNTYLMLWREDEPGYPVYKWFVGATSLCIGEHYPDVAYLRVVYDDCLYYLIGPGAGSDDNLPRLKIVADNQRYKPNDVIVKFRDGPGDQNALWQIFADGFSQTSPDSLWYPIPCNAETESPSSSPSASPTAGPSDMPSSSPSIPPSASPSASLSSRPSSKPSVFPSDQPSTNPSSSESTPCTCADDGNLCTINFCNTTTNMCESEPVTCGQNEACDAFTGLCQDLQNVVPCVAVIDEWDFRDYSSEWAEFRSLYPQRPFCLLVPQNSCTDIFVQPEVLALPTGFMNDTVNNPDGIDRTTVATVTRDGDYGCGDALASDWFSECGLDILSPESITFVGLFIDTSGSMTLSTVEFAYNKFLSNLHNASITYDQVFNGLEEWIDPFFTDLMPPTNSPAPTYSVSPSGLPSLRPSNLPSRMPSLLPSSLPSVSTKPTSKTQAPSPLPSVTPSAVLSSSPSDEPSDRPSESPSKSPSSSPSTSPSETFALELTTVATTAGESIGITPLLEDDVGLPINPLPAIIYTVSFLPTEATGTLPSVSSLGGTTAVQTYNDTRGVYTVTATVEVGGSMFLATENFVVLATASPSSMDGIYADLSESLNGIAHEVKKMEEAALNDDEDSFIIALNATKDYRDTINLEELRLTSICHAENGFFPTAEQVEADGYPATPDDIVFATDLENIATKIMSLSGALDLDSEVAVLESLNAEISVLADEVRGLKPTPYGWAFAQEQINYIYAIAFPRFVHSETGSLERIAIAQGVGRIRHLSSNDERALVGLSSIGVALGVRNRIIRTVVNKVYKPLIIDLGKMVLILQLSNLLRSYVGDQGGMQVITGASLSFHVFDHPNSLIEINGANKKYPERTDVWLIGANAIDAASGFLLALKPPAFNNLNDVYGYFKGVFEAIKGVADAADLANQSPSGISTCLINADNPSCTGLVFGSGFESVNTCVGFLCNINIKPVLFLVRNLDNGGSAQAVENFLTN